MGCAVKDTFRLNRTLFKRWDRQTPLPPPKKNRTVIHSPPQPPPPTHTPIQNKTNTQMPRTLMQRWKPEPLYQSSAPEVGDWPFSPVQSARKFWVGVVRVVWGVGDELENQPSFGRPTAIPAITTNPPQN